MEKKSIHRGPGTPEGLGNGNCCSFSPFLVSGQHDIQKGFPHLNLKESLLPSGLSFCALGLHHGVDNSLKSALAKIYFLGENQWTVSGSRTARAALCCPLLAQSLKSQWPILPVSYIFCENEADLKQLKTNSKHAKSMNPRASPALPCVASLGY